MKKIVDSIFKFLDTHTVSVFFDPIDEIDVEIIKNNMRTVGMSREEYFQLLERI